MILMRLKSSFFVLTLLALTGCKGESFTGSGETQKPATGGGDGNPKEGGPNNPTGQGPNDNTDPDLKTDGGSVEISKLKKPKFGLMATDLRCGMCHLTVNGDISTVDSVKSFEADRSLPAPGSDDHIRNVFPVGRYDEIVNGSWFVRGSFPKSAMKLTVKDGIKEKYAGEEIPKSFPVLDLSKVEKVALGSLDGFDNKGSPVKISGIATSNTILDGSKGPITIRGEVFIKGDLVIVGKYSGKGTIYTSGNIYIAGDITATNSVFPFPSTRAAAMAKGKTEAMSGQMDALGLVSNSSIIFADPNHQTVTGTPHDGVPPVAPNNIIKWFPGYFSFFNGKIGKGIKSRWDVFFYASHMIAGKTGPYTVNGGMICKSFHILGAPNHLFGNATAPYRNIINYDFRMAHGLKIFEAFDDSF